MIPMCDITDMSEEGNKIENEILSLICLLVCLLKSDLNVM